MPSANHETEEACLASSLGATPLAGRQTHFRVWAPKRKSVAVEWDRGGARQRHELTSYVDGYFRGVVPGLGAGDGYRYSLDHEISRPDPASRFQPDGVHGDSQIVDPAAFAWQNKSWRGVPKHDLIIYEMHVGTFTEQGTFAAAMQRLPELKDLGVTAVELMPLAQSPGRWNWGYDGVGLFSVRNTYGTPDDLRALVDACHGLGLAVILDVVYNHLGPEGNYLADFGPYFSNKHHTPWGEALDYDGPHAQPVREFIVENALYWLREYHFDGLRLDAVHFMLDDSPWPILDELRQQVANYEQTAGRHIHLIAESNVFDSKLLPADSGTAPEEHGSYDAIWCDDIMHSIYSVVAPEISVTHREYTGWDDLVEALQHGFIYNHFHNAAKARRVTDNDRRQLYPQGNESSLSLLPSFVVGLQTHDSVGNHPQGKRFHHLTSVAQQKAAATLMLLYPAIPLIFMGEESATPSPFHFFVDYQDQRLRDAVDRGRAREYPRQVWSGALSPTDERAFHDSKCAARGDEQVFAWYQALLRLRKEWQRQGYLAPEHLRVEDDRRTAVISLHYEMPGAGSVFVVTKLLAASGTVSDVEVRIDGQLLLDSEGGGPGKSSVVLKSARALVGTGRCTLSKPD